MDKWISNSDADVVLLGGDFNAGPVEEEGSFRKSLSKLFRGPNYLYFVFILRLLYEFLF